MVRVGPNSSKFFVRATTTSYPMDARQIKETAMRVTSAHDRALEIITERRAILLARAAATPEKGGVVDHPTDDRSQVMLHVVPLFPAAEGMPLTDQSVVDRFAEVRILGWPGEHNQLYSLEGLYTSYSTHARAGYLRSGAVEFQAYGIAESGPVTFQTGGLGSRYIKLWELEQHVLQTLDECAGLTAAGLLPLPVVVSLSLAGVHGTRLQVTPRLSRISPVEIDIDLVSLTPIVLHGWDRAAAVQVRAMFDQLSQAWGMRQSQLYDVDGRRMWFMNERVKAPPPIHWESGWEAGV
jgi:hypothetical protein